MKKILRHIVLTISISVLCSAYGQDVYFSQFYASPLTLNPALTGFAPEDMQLAMNYRNANNGLIPYSTYAASLDMKLMRMKLKPDMFAVGISSTMDDVDKGRIRNLMAVASATYHKAIGSNRTSFISLGLQTGVFQRQTNPNSFSYPVQWTDKYGYDETLPNNESFVKDQTLKPDINAGLFWYGRLSESTSLFLGSSVYHINQPIESFLANKAKLQRRYVFHGGSRFRLDRSTSMVPSVIVMYQNGAQQICEGTTFEFQVGETNSSFKLGGWYRHFDGSFIFLAGLRINSLQIGVSSDFLSRMQTLSKSNGALEFSLIYTFQLKDYANLKANPRNRY